MANFNIKRNYTVSKIKEIVVRQMKSLGTYQPEFDTLIDVYADTIRQYNLALKTFEDEGYQYEKETERGSTKKSGTASALESLRKDIGTLSDRLMLNPKTLKDYEKKSGDAGSKLDNVMKAFFDD